MILQESDDGSDWTEEGERRGGGERQQHVRPPASTLEDENGAAIESPVGIVASTTIRIAGSSKNSAGIVTTPKKSNGHSSTIVSDKTCSSNNNNNNMNDLKTPKMSSSSKRPPSKSPGTSKSPARSALNKSPKMPPPMVATTSLSPPPSAAAASASAAAAARKPERQLSFANGLTISQHSHSTKGRSSIDSTRTNSTSVTSTTSTATNASTSQSRRRSRRKVQWKKSVRVNVIPNLSYFSTQEKLLTWYTADEYSLMEDECDLTSECLDARKPLWPGFCARGLESWTLDGEQRKEQHVQLAIDIVWQAQLDQWRQASNTDECWEFIRSQYLQVSKQCLKLAAQLAQADEREIQPYLSSVKALEKSRRKMLGLRSRSSSRSRGGTGSSSKRIIRRGKVVRTVSDTTAIERQVLSQSAHGPDTRRSPRRCLSDMPSTPTLPILRPAIKYTDGWDQTPVAGSNRGSRRGKSRSASDAIGYVTEDNDDETSNTHEDDDDDDDTDGSSTLASSIVEAYSNKKKLANKKIEFKPKSKTKVPTSPVGSLAASITTTDSSSIIRRMRSHLSVASDESTRRRITRTAAMKVPL
ncbi:hypothetical protein IV203_022600 [Nitzschia inconspicua]|uniref:Uncharacterized protein n=1 Tax=Nitzschia inconspicua TaxID=303405 RepID=A0A9K3PEH6_9STRA|nr:hypothetical protein IV203_022600 [Nitzschia inconspicua]